MDQLFLKTNGNFIPRCNLRPINIACIHNPVDINKMDTFYALIDKIWDTAVTPPKTNEPEAKEECDEFEDNH